MILAYEQWLFVNYTIGCTCKLRKSLITSFSLKHHLTSYTVCIVYLHMLCSCTVCVPSPCLCLLLYIFLRNSWEKLKLGYFFKLNSAKCYCSWIIHKQWLKVFIISYASLFSVICPLCMTAWFYHSVNGEVQHYRVLYKKNMMFTINGEHYCDTINNLVKVNGIYCNWINLR